MNTETRHTDHWQERYAMSTSIFREASLEDALCKIAAGGFKWIEVCGSEFHLDPRSNPNVAAARNAFRQTGLRVHALHTPFTGLKLGHPNRTLKREWLRVIGASLEIGAEVGAPLAVIHVTGDPSELTDAVYEASKEVAIEFIEELRLRARQLGITLALENMTRRSHLRRRFGMSLQEMCNIFHGADIGFCLDVGHAAACRLDMVAEIKAAGNRLISIHADSNDGDDDLHWLPTRGILDWPATKNWLAEGGYRGRYVIELKGHNDPDGVFAQAVAFAKMDGGNSASAPCVE